MSGRNGHLPVTSYRVSAPERAVQRVEAASRLLSADSLAVWGTSHV